MEAPLSADGWAIVVNINAKIPPKIPSIDVVEGSVPPKVDNIGFWHNQNADSGHVCINLRSIVPNDIFIVIQAQPDRSNAFS